MDSTTTSDRDVPIAEVDRRRHLGGVAMVLLATGAWSFSGVFTRLLTTDIYTAIAWRSLFGGLFLAVAQGVVYRIDFFGSFRKLGRSGLWLVCAQIVCHACTVGALYLTSVADVTLIYATAPFIAAGLAWWMLGERMAGRTLWASLVTLLGPAIIVAGSFKDGHSFGDLLALGMTLSFAVVIVLPRAEPQLPTLPATVLSALGAFALFVPFSSPASTPERDWLVLAAFGFVNFTLALFLFLAGAKRIPSAEAALIGALELVLAPAWVWLFFGEAPSPTVLIAGAITGAAVVAHTALDLARSTTRRRPGALQASSDGTMLRSSRATVDGRTMTASVSGLNHITLAVGDLDRALGFYEGILGCALRARWSEGAYLEAGSLWLCLLVGKVTPRDDYTHIAFDATEDAFHHLSEKIASTCPLWQTNSSEGSSVYMLDPDGHRLELHVGSLASRLDHYRARGRADIEIVG